MKPNILWMLLLLAMQPLWAQTDEEPEEEETPPNTAIYWGVKGGLTLASQKWNTFQRRSLFTFHAAALLDIYGRWSQGAGIKRRFGLGIGLGYHQRGSSYRVFNLVQGQRIPKDVFHNISLLVAGKGQFRMAPRWLFYYGLGLRAEFTAAWTVVNPAYAPYVRRLNYGVWFGTGIEFTLNRVGMFIEISLSPDVSRQVFVPEGVPLDLIDPSTGLNVISRQEKVNNLSLEVSLGVRFGNNKTE